MSNPLDIDEVAARMRTMSALQRRGALQQLIGPESNDPDVLQYRAILMTALREYEIWPVVKPAMGS